MPEPITPNTLRDAGYVEEADLIDAAYRRTLAYALRPRDAPRYRTIALSVLGTRRFDELALLVGFEGYANG